MSEFKYACPVCGQHIKCDSSQAGTEMECPTCFQKITVPQAPASEDQKFILTGTKKTERPIPKAPESNGPAVAKTSSIAVVTIIIIVLGLVAAGGVAYKFRDKIFKTAGPVETAQNPEEETNKPVATAPAVVAPHANDTNWMMNLATVEIPDGPAVGRIHGQD